MSTHPCGLNPVFPTKQRAIIHGADEYNDERTVAIPPNIPFPHHGFSTAGYGDAAMKYDPKISPERAAGYGTRV